MMEKVDEIDEIARSAGGLYSYERVLPVDDARRLVAEAEARGRQLLEQRIREIVATSRGLGLSRGTCESLCEELLEETSEDMAKLHKQERDEDMAKSEARGRAAERADVVACWKSMAPAYYAENRVSADELVYRVERGEHVVAAGKGET